MDSNMKTLLVGLMFITFLLGMSLGILLVTSFHEAELIERGFAEYNQISGDWQWKEK